MIIPEGYGQVNLEFAGTALPTGAQVTYGLSLDVTPLPLGDIPEAIAVAWSASNMRALMTTTTALVKVSLKVGPNATGPTYEFAANVQGTDAGQAVTPNTSILFKKVTAFGGRAGSGRFYLPSFDETEVDLAGNLSPAMVTAAQNAVNAFKTAHDDDNLTWTLLHGEGSVISTPSEILSIEVQNKVATQRRRLRR